MFLYINITIIIPWGKKISIKQTIVRYDGLKILDEEDQTVGKGKSVSIRYK